MRTVCVLVGGAILHPGVVVQVNPIVRQLATISSHLLHDLFDVGSCPRTTSRARKMMKAMSLKLSRRRDVRNTGIHQVAFDGFVLDDVEANVLDIVIVQATGARQRASGATSVCTIKLVSAILQLICCRPWGPLLFEAIKDDIVVSTTSHLGQILVARLCRQFVFLHPSASARITRSWC